MPRLRLSPTLLAILVVSLFLAGCGGGDEEDSEPREPFSPQATLTAIGGTKRTDKPEVVLRVKTRPGDTNIRSAAVTLPPVFVVEQAALGNLCSERELEANDCAGRKRLGVARVVSPTYSEALTGPVYPVSGSGGLPRLAYLLGEGPAGIVLRGRIAIRGVRIEAGVDDVPDVPMDTFELSITGGDPGYLILNQDICRREAIANASFTSQSGEAFERRIPLEADCDA
ncbi:MAG TPA: hypothetical protein VNP96_08825 [Solirubrobacterales bacterium]|nr:hypothetical protein [Solirubrobacterales bacterium]